MHIFGKAQRQGVFLQIAYPVDILCELWKERFDWPLPPWLHTLDNMPLCPGPCLCKWVVDSLSSCSRSPRLCSCTWRSWSDRTGARWGATQLRSREPGIGVTAKCSSFSIFKAGHKILEFYGLLSFENVKSLQVVCICNVYLSLPLASPLLEYVVFCPPPDVRHVLQTVRIRRSRLSRCGRGRIFAHFAARQLVRPDLKLTRAT